VKHWQELEHILDRVLRLARDGRGAALAVVTRIRGSAYRRAGAKMLIEDDGAFIGGVSGGCLEADVREVGLEVIRTGRARVLHYDTGGDDTQLWGLGLGCEGEVDLSVQPISPAAALGPWAAVRDRLRGDAPITLSTVVGEGAAADAGGDAAAPFVDPAGDPAVAAAAAEALRTRQPRLDPIGARTIFTDVLFPPPKLLICGAGDDARPTVAFAAAAGFRVFVADHRRAYLTAQRFPETQRLLLMRSDDPSDELPADRDTYVVVKTHALKHDTGWVRRLIAGDVRYLGVLGPRARLDKILAGLGVAPDKRVVERIFGPVGLDLGADGPEQVGLSIVAELLAVRSGRTPRHLRDRTEAIHDGAS
jgi:xanthine dehydrogenase accessory factor